MRIFLLAHRRAGIEFIEQADQQCRDRHWLNSDFCVTDFDVLAMKFRKIALRQADSKIDFSGRTNDNVPFGDLFICRFHI